MMKIKIKKKHLWMTIMQLKLWLKRILFPYNNKLKHQIWL